MPNYFRALSFFIVFCLQTSLARAEWQVLTTVNFLADLAQELSVGTPIQVDSLMGPGVDPHLYKMSAGDLGKIRKADLLLAVGLHLEGKMQESLRSLAKRQQILFVGDSIAKEKLLSISSDRYNHDPHIWFDPALWMECAQTVAATLQKAQPTLADRIEANRKRYVKELEDLFLELKQSLDKELPTANRVLITSHDAFRYFGRAFQFEVHGILGVSTDSEVGLRRIEELSKLIKERKIRAIFIENSVPPALSEGLRSASGARIGGQLFGDSLGDKSSPAGKYVGMLRYNVRTIIEGLKK